MKKLDDFFLSCFCSQSWSTIFNLKYFSRNEDQTFACLYF